MHGASHRVFTSAIREARAEPSRLPVELRNEEGFMFTRVRPARVAVCVLLSLGILTLNYGLPALASGNQNIARNARGIAANALSQAGPAAPSSTPTFGRPTISGIQGLGFEPNLRVGPNGRVYTSEP